MLLEQEGNCNLKLCPLILLSRRTVILSEKSNLICPKTIVYKLVKSFLSLHSSRLSISSFANLWQYVKFRIPGSFFVNFRCTDSMFLMSFIKHGFQMLEQYSSWGRTYTENALRRLASSLDVKQRSIRLDFLWALRQTLSMCVENFNLLSIVTPMSEMVWTFSNCVPQTVYWKLVELGLLHKSKTAHFKAEIDNGHIFAQSQSLSRLLCKSSKSSGCWSVEYSLTSSAYNLKHTVKKFRTNFSGKLHVNSLHGSHH